LRLNSPARTTGLETAETPREPGDTAEVAATETNEENAEVSLGNPTPPQWVPPKLHPPKADPIVATCKTRLNTNTNPAKYKRLESKARQPTLDIEGRFEQERARAGMQH